MMHRKRGFKGRKAQITVFMIVGIILLFSSALIFYIKNQVTEGMPAEFVPSVEEVPMEAQPVKLYVENCLNRMTAEALKHAGAHGGYIDPTSSEYGRIFAAGPLPTESDALQVFEGGKGLVPYWWYMKSSNNCIEGCGFQSNQPPLTGSSGIEPQIELYIKNNLGRCIQDFRQFTKQGFEVDVLGEIEPEVTLTEKDVGVLLTYPVRVNKEGRSTDVEQFFTKVDVPLKQVYEFASKIMESEVSQNFLERHTMNLISMYSKPVSMEKLPPTAHFTFGPGEYMLWTRTETQERLENWVLPPGISMLQIYGTGNYQRNVLFGEEGYQAVATGILDKMIVTLNSSEDFSEMHARFSYLDWWPIFLDINHEEVLEPTSVGPAFTGPLFDLLGFNEYKFRYFLSFPVLVTITAPEAFNGEGYKFTFALESNIRNNLPMNSSYEGLPVKPDASYLCAPEQRNAGPYRIFVEDEDTGEPIEGARVDFIAGNEMCTLGLTELDAEGKASIFADFPVGAGEIRITKEDYLPVRERFGSFINDTRNETFKLVPIMMINGTAQVKALQYQDGEYILPEVPISSLDPDEKVMITLNRVPDDEYGDFSSYLMYNLSDGPQEIMIVPGDYDVDGYLLRYERVVIPAETKTVDIPFKDDEKITLNESVYDRWSEGGVVLNNLTGRFTITKEDIENHNNIRFYVLRFPIPSTHSSDVGSGPDLEQLGMYEELSNEYRTELEPQFTTLE